MRDPKRMLIWMLVFLAAVGVVCAVLFVPLRQAFEANQLFNGFILSVLLIGVVINMTQVFTLDTLPPYHPTPSANSAHATAGAHRAIG